MNAIDFSHDRGDFTHQLRLFAQWMEEQARTAVANDVRLPYTAPQLVVHGTLPPKAVAAFRARRNALFGHDLFGEPGWDMLLELYRARQEERRLSVKSLTIAANAPQTTAGRHLARLIEEGLAACSDDPGDGRRKLVAISRDGFRKMDALFDQAA